MLSEYDAILSDMFGSPFMQSPYTPRHLRTFSSLIINIYVCFADAEPSPAFNIRILPGYETLKENKDSLISQFYYTESVRFLSQHPEFALAFIEEIKDHLDRLPLDSPFRDYELREGEIDEIRKDIRMELSVWMRVRALLNGAHRHQVVHATPNKDEVEAFLKHYSSKLSDSVWELALATVTENPWSLDIDTQGLNLGRRF